jgi:hypothetical protein
MVADGVAESVELDVPAQWAFDFLADPTTATVIDPAIREYRPDALPMGLGTRTTIRMRMWGLPLRAVSVVQEWEPGVRMEMANERPARPVRIVARHRFAPAPAPAGAERCTYTWEIDVVPTVRFAAPVAHLMARFLRGNARAQQVRFKAEVERRWRTRPPAEPT